MHLYPKHNVTPTRRHKSFSTSMSCIFTSATPYCITARLLSSDLGWILCRRRGCVTSTPCQDAVSSDATQCRKRQRKGERGEIKFMLGERDRKIANGERVRQWMEWVGGALQQSCTAYRAYRLIGCTAIRKLEDEDKLALYNNQA